MREKLVVSNWIATTAFLGVLLGVTVLFWNEIPPQIPLFYSKPWGESQLASKMWLWGLAAASLALGGVNFFASKKIGDLVLSTMTCVSMTIAQLIITLGFLRILLVVL